MSVKPFVAVLPPKSFTASAAAIKNILKMGWIDIPPEKEFNGNAAPGDYLEHLLGGAKNNRDSPDLNDWEVKFHGGNALLTLFHKEPQPRGIMKFMVHEHGWPDEQLRTSFRHTLGGKSNRGFYVVNEPDRITVRHNAKDNPAPYWKHDTLLNCLGAKLRRLIVVDGEIQTNPTKRVIYRTATAYWEFKQTGFFQALVDGKVYIDFDARTKDQHNSTLRNHGTKFRIKLDDIPSIYEHSKKIT
jgi:hypothetical protein